MAHRSVWESMLQKGMPAMAVFEDDVRFTKDFAEVFPKAFAELPADWDLLYLGCQTCAETTWMDAIYGAGFQKIKQHSPHLVVPPMMLGTEAYLISQRGARKLLDWTRTNGFHLDFLISNHKDQLDYFSVSPQIAYQSAEEIASSANTTPTPVLLNQGVSWIQLNPGNPYDVRSLDWVLTINLYSFVPLGLPITGWWLVMAVMAFVSSYAFIGLFVYLLIESVIYPDRWRAYVSLLLALGVGRGLRIGLTNLIVSLSKWPNAPSSKNTI